METVLVAAIGAVATLGSAWISTRAPRRTPGAEPADDAAPEGRGGRRRDRRADARRLLARLPPVRAGVRPWLAGVLGFLFGGFGVALYLRTWLDAAVGAVLLVPLGISGSGGDGITPWWYWIFASLAGVYAALRAGLSNRRRASGEEKPPQAGVSALERT